MTDRPGAWFKRDGEVGGERTLAEQLRGVGGAVAECAGKSVVDFGCAEGCIAQVFALAGASSVLGIDYNDELIAEAQRLTRRNLNFVHADIRDLMQAPVPHRFDIVLALAVIHKLPDPEAGARFMADCTGSLMVVRLPKGSKGHFRGKNWPWNDCDLTRVLKSRGLTLESTAPGARGELVQYWRR